MATTRTAHRLLMPRTQRVSLALMAAACRLLLLLGVLGITLAGSVPSASATSSPQPTLPLPVQAAISGVLGRDDPRYHATSHDQGLHMTNPRHHLAVELTPAGLRLQHGGAHWGLTWQGYGYGAVPPPSPAVAPLARGNRVEYRRGAVTEWYVNGPRGLQQGFTLQASPGPRTGAPLTLYLTLSGTLHARVEPGQTGLTLISPDGAAVLAYRGLTAWDATGRALPARLQLQGHALRLQIEDAGARYPLVVDPFVEQAKLTASDGAAGDEFGFSVAISGDTVVVGADGDNSDQGSAYVFVKPGGGWATTSAFTAKLTASDGAAGDYFGASVAISGDTVVVGADGDNSDQGSAYVFGNPVSTVALTVSGSGPGPALINPVLVRYSLQGCGSQEIFLVLDAPAMGIPWSYLGIAGWVPLPADLATITPFSSGRPDGTYTLFEGAAPAGTYELYLGCDFVNDGVLNIDAGGNVNGVYDHRVVTVQ